MKNNRIKDMKAQIILLEQKFMADKLHMQQCYAQFREKITNMKSLSHSYKMLIPEVIGGGTVLLLVLRKLFHKSFTKMGIGSKDLSLKLNSKQELISRSLRNVTEIMGVVKVLTKFINNVRNKK